MNISPLILEALGATTFPLEATGAVICDQTMHIVHTSSAYLILDAVSWASRAARQFEHDSKAADREGDIDLAHELCADAALALQWVHGGKCVLATYPPLAIRQLRAPRVVTGKEAKMYARDLCRESTADPLLEDALWILDADHLKLWLGERFGLALDHSGPDFDVKEVPRSSIYGTIAKLSGGQS